MHVVPRRRRTPEEAPRRECAECGIELPHNVKRVGFRYLCEQHAAELLAAIRPPKSLRKGEFEPGDYEKWREQQEHDEPPVPNDPDLHASQESWMKRMAEEERIRQLVRRNCSGPT